MPEPCLLQLSTEAKEAPYNEAATLAVEFFVTAEKAILGSLQAFCTFLGKVHETGTFSSWSSEEENVGKCSGSDAQPCESLTKEGTMHPSEDCCQLATVNYELSLTPFSFPATFCEQFIKETFTFTVVRTQDLNQDGAQRKDTQTKTSAKSDGREKGGKRAGPPRSIIPPGESRVAEMPVGALLLLKEGERMQPPEGVQEVLATIPGVVSLRIEVKAVTSLLSPELRHLLNPVWFLIRDVRYLPLTSPDLQKPQPNDAPECTAENAASAVAPAAGAGAAASASATPVVSSGAPASESKGACAEIHLRGESSSEGRCSTAGPFEYFARAQVLGKETEAVPSSVSVSISLPQQGINRLFFAAPLWNKVAAQAKQLQRKEEGRFGYMLQGSNSKVGMKGAAIYEGDVDILTGFLIADGRQASMPQSEFYFVNH
ncbi:hypothetical protein, conserved [Eimeria praecox]|uniref:Uncharacterized protein n=1 Tax=Eimeria praecox TaxID=51316 RepID=U6GX92_9EIME|nr:hypothetical protein, conserved [Eimeria praecox]